MTIDDANGNIGIATDSPETLLTVAASGSSAQIEIKRTNTNAAGAIGALNFTAMDGHSVANIFAQGDGDNEGADLVFKTTSAAAENDPYGSGTLERLRITSDGDVGIAFASPLGKLHVRAADECNFVVREEATSLVLSAETNNGRDNNRLMTLEGAGLVINSSGNEKFRITSAGDVGIGTVDPTGTSAVTSNTATLAVGIATLGGLHVNGNAYPSSGGLSHRNLIINGDMRIDQRETGV